MLSDDDTVLLPALQEPVKPKANVVPVPFTRRILTNKCLREPVHMRSCWENGVDIKISLDYTPLWPQP